MDAVPSHSDPGLADERAVQSAPADQAEPATSAERFAAFARIGADWFWETDAEGRFTYFSQGSHQTTLHLSSRLGRTRREGAVQDSENLARLAALDELIARRQPFRDFLYRAQLGDEQAVWCAISGEPVLDRQGTFRGYRGVGRNVHELIETQLALQTKTRVLDAVLAAMPDAIRVLDAEGRTLSVNDQFYTLFALDKAEMLAAPDPIWYSMLEMARRGEYGPGDPTELARARYSLLQGADFHYERKLQHGPWMEARGVPVEGGGRLTIYRDITERKQAEQALLDLNASLERRVEERTATLAERERFHRATLDSIHTRLAVLDGAGRVIATNAAWRRFAEGNVPAWHAVGDRDDYVLACQHATGPGAEEARAVATAIREIVAGQRTSFEVEYRVVTATEERFFLCRVLRIGDEPPVRMVVAHDDVTVVRQAEQQARRAQRLEAIGTLAGGIAHDLNNALTPILMGLDLLSAAAPDHADTIEMMLASANHGAEMLKRLLTFARGAEGRRVPVRVHTLVGDVERIAQGTFPKSIRLRSQVQPDLPLVHADPTQLHQVLLNLWVNARDAMPNGGTLLVTADIVAVDETFALANPGARPGEFVRLSVRDTGLGIAAGDLERIFDPFFTTKTADLGTGLGLSTALGIVQAHDGFIQVESTIGCGSTFSVYLPAVGLPSAADRAGDDEHGRRGAAELILVVDDEPSIRQLYRVVLGQLGFRVIVAVDGVDGLEQVERHQTELAAIITDVRMPTLDGLGFVRALRERGVDIPLAIASGRIEDAQLAELERLGITTRLNKPFTQRRLLAALRELLGRDLGAAVSEAAGR